MCYPEWPVKKKPLNALIYVFMLISISDQDRERSCVRNPDLDLRNLELSVCGHPGIWPSPVRECLQRWRSASSNSLLVWGTAGLRCRPHTMYICGVPTEARRFLSRSGCFATTGSRANWIPYKSTLTQWNSRFSGEFENLAARITRPRERSNSPYSCLIPGSDAEVGQ